MVPRPTLRGFARRLTIRASASLAALIPIATHAQFVFNESFSHTTFDQSGWVVNSSNGTYVPQLTAATGADANGSGWLRMTDNNGNEATYARLTTPIPSANNNISVDMKYQMWTPNGTGADGFTISLRDASAPNFDVGAFGGSLGYAQKNTAQGGDTTHAGMVGGYFSVGVDAYGNFSSYSEGRQGGYGNTYNSGFQPNAIAVRGPGSGSGTNYNGGTNNNYAYINGTTNLAQNPYNLGNINFTNVTARPSTDSSLTQAQRDANDRELVFNFTTGNLLTVSMRFGTTGTLTQVFQADLTSLGTRPDNLELVFTAGTGGLMQYTDIQGLSITTSGAPVGTVFYSNYAGDNKWGNGNNWGSATTPNLGVVPLDNANLVFSNHAFTAPAYQLTTAQNIDLGANRSAGSVQFDAPFNYTLQGYNLTLDSGQPGTPTAITVTSAAPGGAHTIQSAITLNSDLNINTNTGTALNLSGAIAAGTHTFTLNNNGTTTISGQITGTGALTQTAGSAGTTVLTGDNSSTYTGDINVQDGTLQLGNSAVLNPGTNLSLSTANTTGTFDLANNDQTVGNITFVSGGTVQSGSGTLTLNGTITSQSSATAASMTGKLNLGSASRTFDVADGGANPDLVVAADIAGTGGINKTGNGSLSLGGLNTFSGANTLTAGTTIAASNSALGTGASTLSSGATIALQGGINLASGTIAVSGSGYAGSNGALDNLSGSNALASAVTLAGATTIGAAAGTQLSLNGPIGQSSAGQLTIGGAGTVVFGNSNTYTGATLVNSGATLVAAANNALGATGGTTSVSSGGTLAFQGGVNYSSSNTVTVSGAGAAGRNGAIDNVSGSNTFAGGVALAGATTIGAAAGSNLNLAGAVSGANALTVGGAGVVTLSGANTYTGTTTINSGATLVAASNDALGNTGTNTATTVASGGSLGLQGGITVANENITINGTGVNGGGALANPSGSNAIANPVNLGSSSTVDAAAGSTLTLSGGISGGAVNLTKADSGTVVVAGAATYTGTTTITGGTLAFAGAGTLGSAANITVTNGALAIDNSAVNNPNRISSSAPIALNDGAIRFVGNGSASSTGLLGTVTATTGANTVYLQAQTGQQADLTIGNLVQNGSATVTFTTDPTATLGAGTTNAGTPGSPRVFLTQIGGVNTTGTLAAPVALAGWILVNDVNGSANFAEYTGGAGTGNGVRALSNYYTGSQGININSSTTSVLLTSASPLSAYQLTHSNTTTDANLKITDAATVDLNTSSTRTLRLNSGGLIKSGATTTTISGAGRLSTGSGGTLAVTVDNAGGVLNISAPIIDNGTTKLTKAGAGLLTLTGANTFKGGVNINDGTLRISAENGLGSTTATKTITFNGGTLNVTSGFTANTAKTWTVGANGTGTLDIDSGQTLALTGAGKLTSSATSSLVKAGAGNLQIGADNTGFTGATTVNNGTLELDSANALGTNHTTTLNGGTLSLKNNAAATFATNITVAADATINTDRVSGTTTGLTLTLGSVAIGGNTLTTTGAHQYALQLGAVTLSGAATLNPTTVGSDLTVGAISGSGSLTKTGAANLTLSAAATYTGSTTVNAGTLFTQGTDYLPTATALTIADGAAVNTGGASQTLASLAGGAGTGTATFNLGAGALTVGDSTTTSFGGTITAAALTKVGSGSITLGGGATNAISSFAINDGTVVAAKSAGDATGSGPVTIGDSVGAPNSAVLQLAADNQINDASDVTINSDGRLDLNNHNDAVGSVAGSGAITLGSGTLTLAGNSSTTYTGSISGTGGWVKNGTGTLVLSGASSYSGATAINAGTVQIGSSTALGTGAGGVTVANNAGLELQNNINVAGSALTIAGTGAAGNGALRNISGDNTWGGAVTLAGDSTVNISAGNLYLNGGIATGTSTLTVDGPGNTQAVGAVTGSGNVVKNGIGALVFGSTGNSYTGATTVNAGSVQFNANNAGPAASAVNLAASGATLNVNNYTATVGSLAGVDGSDVVLGAGSLTAGGTNATTAFNGAISGAGGSFTKIGSGTTTLGGSGANTLSGGFNVNDGTVILAKSAGLDATGTGALTIGDMVGNPGSAVVQLNAANQINDAVAVGISLDGQLNLNGNSETIGSLASGWNTAEVVLGSGTLTTGGNGASTIFAGTISGAGALVKTGTGTMTLSGTNTYTGGTTVAGGTLALSASNALGSTGSLTISSGAQVSLGSGVTQTVAGLTLNATSTISLGTNATLAVNTASASTLLGSLTGTGNLTYAGGGNLTIGNTLNFGGTLTIGGTTVGGTPTTTVFIANNLTVGTLHITGDTILDFGNSTTTSLNAGTLVIDQNVKVTVLNWVNMSNYFIASNFFSNNGGTLTAAVPDARGTTPENQFTFDPTTYTNNNTGWVSYDHEITPAPEPAWYGLIFMSAVVGLVGARTWRRRKRRTRRDGPIPFRLDAV